MIENNMSTKQKILTFAVIFSLIGISSLYIFSGQRASRDIRISKIDEGLVGSRISTEGNISEISWFSYMVLFELKEKETEEALTVNCERDMIEDLEDKKTQLTTGARVRVEGKLERYEGEINLKVDSNGGLSVIREAYSSFTPISHVLENPRWHENMNIKVRGEITNRTDSDLGEEVTITGLQDDRYRLRCEIESPEEYEDKELLGKPVVLKGRLTYYNKRGYWKLRCSEFSDVKAEKAV